MRNAGHFIPPTRPHPSDDNPSSLEDGSNQTVFQGQTTQKLVSSDTGKSQSTSTGMQTSTAAPVPTGMTGTTQTGKQVGGTQRSPPPLPKKSRSEGGTQTMPPRNLHQDQGTQGQPDCNW